MRNRILAALGDLVHRQFLVYLMGPYKPFDIRPVLEAIEQPLAPNRMPERIDFRALLGSDVDHIQQKAVFDLLLFVRDRLRIDPGVNAFLAIDIDIPLEELDAGTQSIEFAFASNAVIYIVPKIGANLGVGIEAGSVLEAIYRERATGDPDTSHHQRVLFIHEEGVRSAMLAALQDRWDARVSSYTNRTDLVRQIRLFIRDLVRREQRGELPALDKSPHT